MTNRRDSVNSLVRGPLVSPGNPCGVPWYRRSSFVVVCLLLPTACDSVTTESTETSRLGLAAASFRGAEVIDDGAGTRSQEPTPVRVSRMSAFERSQLSALKPVLTASVGTPALTPHQRSMAVANRTSANTDLRVVVELDGAPVDFEAVKVSKAALPDLADKRRQEVKPDQDRVEAALRALGGHDFGRMEWFNYIAATLPAGAFAAAEKIAGVKNLLIADAKPSQAGYSGNESRVRTLDSALISANFDGRAFSRTSTTNRVKLGILEFDCANPRTNLVNRSHAVFRDTSSLSSLNRVVGRFICSGGVCSASTLNGGNTHATWVSWVAAGSIEQGQDSNFTGAGTTAQRDHSGLSRETTMNVYSVCDCTDISAALNQAITDGVDITNWSFRTSDCQGGNLDCGGINSALAATQEAGIVNVVAAGNPGSYSANSCNAQYPSWRPEVIGVNGLDSSNPAQDYNTRALVDGCSARGGVPIQLFTGLSPTMAGIGITAPAIYRLSAASGTNTYNAGDICGTSFATPTITGITANMRNALNSVGFPGNDARILRDFVLIMGDSWDGNQDGTVKNATSVSLFSGSGRVHAHWPGQPGLVAPVAWGWRYFGINQGESVSWTVGDAGPETGTTQWKMMLSWDEPDLSSAADIDVTIVDTCPPGGGTQIVASQLDYDIRNRFQLRNISAKCLEVRVQGFNVPPGGRSVHAVYYRHGGNPDQH